MAGAKFNDKAVLALILCVALVLRMIGLNQPLWYDELITLYTHLRLPWSDMMSGYEMNHHYLFSFQAKGLSAILGESAWSLRLPALLFGVASIWAVWKLVCDVAETRIAHITAGLLAISYHHIWFSQNARGYTELMFWCVLGLILFLRGLHGSNKLRWIGFGIVLALAVFTHLTGFFFFFALGVVWLVWVILSFLWGELAPRQFWLPAMGFALGGFLCLLLYSPVLMGVLDNAATVGGTSKVDAMQEFQNPIWTVIEAVRTVASGLGPLIGLVALAIVTLSVLGGVRVWPQEPLFPVVVFAHIALTMLILYALGMRIWPRFFFVDIGLLMALIVMGVAWVSDQISKMIPALPARMIFRLGVAGMVMVSAVMTYQNYRAPKQNIPGPMELIAAQSGPNDQVAAVGFVADVYTDFLGTDWANVKTDAQLAQVLRADAPLWLVVGFPTRTFRAVAGLEAAVADFELVKRFPGTLGDGAMLVYRRANP